MLHIVFNNDILQRVLRSVTKNGMIIDDHFHIDHHCLYIVSFSCLFLIRYSVAMGGFVRDGNSLHLLSAFVRLLVGQVLPE